MNTINPNIPDDHSDDTNHNDTTHNADGGDSTMDDTSNHATDSTSGTPLEKPEKKPRTMDTWGYAFLLILPLIALMNVTLSPFFSAVLSDRIPAVLEFEEPTAITVAGSERAVEGLAALSIPTADLSAWAIGQFIAAKAILVIGLLVATWFATRVVTEVVHARPFSDRASRGLMGLSWTIVVAGLLAGLAQVPADNLIIRDLGLRDAAVSNSITSEVTYLWIGAVILVEVLRRAVRRGREAQDELEGVI